MIFQILVFLVIVLLAAYLATQGWFSATLSFVCAVFAAILAAAWFEPLSSPINGWRPDYGHGVIFLLTFFLAFSGLRIAADMIVPENVPLPKWLDWSGGGLMGFLAALVVAGAMVLGIEMMPVGTNLMPLAGIAGFNRYPEGLRGQRDGLWLNPDGFVEWIADMACGRGLGGGSKYTFEQAHPDLRQELWGYRERAGLASQFALRPELFAVTGLWSVDNADAAWPAGGGGKEFPADAGRAIVLRTEFERGLGEKISADIDENLRVSASQVRLVATKNGSGETRQFYPVGTIDHGPAAKRYVRYVPLGAYGHVVVDYPTTAAPGTDSGKLNAVIEWVFALPEDFTPTFVEVKVLARQDLPAVEKAAPKLAVTYPVKKWLDQPFALTVAVQDESSGAPVKLKNQIVYIMRNSVKNSSIMSTLVNAAQTLETNRDNAGASAAGWLPNSGEPGSVAFQDLKMAADAARNLALDKGNTATTSWDQVLRATIPSALTPRGSQNPEAVRKYLNETIKPILDKNESLVQFLNTGETGKSQPENLGEGNYVAIAWYASPSGTPDTVYVWTQGFSAEQKKSADLVLTTKGLSFPFRVSTKK